MAILSRDQYKQLDSNNQSGFRAILRDEKIITMAMYLDQSDRLISFFNGVPAETYEDERLVMDLFGRIDLRIDDLNEEIAPIVKRSQSNLIDLSFEHTIGFGILAGLGILLPQEDKLKVIDSLEQPIGLTETAQLRSGFELSSSIWGEENRIAIYDSVLKDIRSGVSKDDMIAKLIDYLTKSGQGGQYYKAERVIETELHRAYARGSIESTRSFNRESRSRLVYERRLSPAHKVPDICDELVGFYDPSDVIPEVGSHPWCTCILTRRFIDDIPDNTEFKQLSSRAGIYKSKVFNTKTTVY